MIFNNVTNTLRRWCDEATDRFCEEYETERANTGQSIRFLSYLVTAELSYKLGTLIDKDHPSFDAYRKGVLDLLPIHMDYTLKKPLGKVEAYYVQRAETAFCKYMDTLLPDCPCPDVPYRRIIQGAEAERIADQVYEAWEYDTTYWFPLNGMSGEDKLFISPQRLHPYLEKISRVLGLPQNRIYEYGEAEYDSPHCAEVDALQDYAGAECAFLPKDFSWIIYFSHENTVAFAGTIVPRIKEILLPEKEHWNQLEWDD